MTSAPSNTSRQRRIALVVLGSLFSGLSMAVLLIMLPFAGAPENVTAAAILLSFAFGWASLCGASMVFTAQPQRWAAIPAVLMGAAGVTLVVWPEAIGRGWLDWLWPPFVAGLVVWMVIRSHTSLQNWMSLALLYPVFSALLLAALGGGYETFQEFRDRRAHAMPGRRIDVGDHRLHIHCTGTGSPTVVLEPGLGEPSAMMSSWIAPAVAGTTRVCVYDRAGRGWSDSATRPQDGTAVAEDLHTLLEHAGEHGPYVLAGHSAGGIYVLNFARLYPDEVAGVVLLDSMHPDQYERLPGWPAFFERMRRASSVMPSLSRVGIGRLIALSSFGGLPSDSRSEQRAAWSTPRHYLSFRDEVSQLRTALTQAGELDGLGSKPLIVVTAGRDALDGWQTLQDDLVMLSSNSIHRNLPGATHASLTEDQLDARASSQAISDVVEAVRTGASLEVRRGLVETAPGQRPTGDWQRD